MSNMNLFIYILREHQKYMTIKKRTLGKHHTSCCFFWRQTGMQLGFLSDVVTSTKAGCWIHLKMLAGLETSLDLG